MPIPRKFPLTPTIIATPYTANTVVGGLLSLLGVPAQGVIRDILVNIDGAITPALDLYFFDSAPTTIIDNAAFAPSYADQGKMLTGDKISIVSGDYQSLNSKTRAHKVAINRDYVAQIQWGLWITGGKWCDHIVYNPDFGGHPIDVTRIHKDETLTELISRKAAAIKTAMTEILFQCVNIIA